MGNMGKGGVDSQLADQQDRESYRRAHERLDQMRIPVLLPKDDPHARLYIAALDGTGNSMVNDDPKSWSVVARVSAQIDHLEKTGVSNIAGGYVEGTFTQEGVLRTPERLLDGRFGHSFDERVETAYFQFCVQAREWLREDPEAKIRMAGIGFSRGAEEVAALERMVHERGIRDPADAKVIRDRDDVIQSIQYADRPPLVAPGKTIQAALLLEPVATGVEDEVRHLPGSNINVFEVSAEDERRDLFKDNDHVPPGLSADGRQLNVMVAGAHSDIGNTYAKNGLGALSFNLSAEYLNRLAEVPYLQKQQVPDDLAQYVIHRSDRHMMGLCRTQSYDKDGVRDKVNDQSPMPGIQHRDPIDPALAAQVKWRRGPVPSSAPEKPAAPKFEQQPQPKPIKEEERTRGGGPRSSTDDLLDRAFSAYMGDDHAMFADVISSYRRSPAGQAWQGEQTQFSESAKAQEAANDAQRAAALMEHQQTMQRAAVMHL